MELTEFVDCHWNIPIVGATHWARRWWCPLALKVLKQLLVLGFVELHGLHPCKDLNVAYSFGDPDE